MEFHIENMTCGGCARGVTKAIETVDPGAKVDARPAERTISVATRLSATEIKRALIAAGFPPTTGSTAND
ncbi:heavy-metal-associated domain-containing protein [Sphingopyxis sp. XHP0097]|uniref:Heavy-metal-associated domain-containing protein n=1 Tax=Sphingopyxis jiangsuensis TaxID=2871171 RepID=A0ABS7MBH8_9SPHN|nr:MULTISPECIES: heavy-metal-associated domain-containing protein [Sphingopyxis]MBL0768101.1 heavy-metal-associated domain-containing protein [Sphingopyxis lutea]MBY4636168.1 heavy-metal-associated domain-containing protein [Sphingopyxis jiangsuensis]